VNLLSKDDFLNVIRWKTIKTRLVQGAEPEFSITEDELFQPGGSDYTGFFTNETVK
jgi:hypothetical protein